MIWMIAFKNMLRHKMSSLIVTIIFITVGFFLFWFQGFSNYISNNLDNYVRVSFGDIVFYFEMTEKEQLTFLKKIPEISTITHERLIKAMVNGEGKNSISDITEINEENSPYLKPFLKPIRGHLPKNSDEMAITEPIYTDRYQIGDTYYITTTTIDKKINSYPFKISGILKGSVLKAAGSAHVITSEGMDALLQSSKHSNGVLIYLDQKFKNAQSEKDIQKKLEDEFAKQNIKILFTMTHNEITKRFEIFSKVFKITKYLLAFICLPLCAIIMITISRIQAYNKRFELWTYSSLGMDDRQISKLFMIEIEYLVVIGTCLGIILGELSSFLFSQLNVWLSFSYSFYCPVNTEFNFLDTAFIIFISCLSTLSALIPIKKILHDHPFSY